MSRSEEERDPIAEEEAEAAAAEAAEIGGRGGYSDTDDPAERPLSEAGEGEAEGFELAEEQLEDIAAHGDQKRFPNREAGLPEEPTDTAYGEPDQAIPDDE
ncbi:MAG: hypothetical protein ACTHN7_01855 [Solirubrobacterales bacterium]